MAETYEDSNGYLRYSDSDRLIHRVVAQKNFHGEGFGNFQVHHIDRNKKNNYPGNLQVVTPQEHRAIHGISEPPLSLMDYIVGFGVLAFIVYVVIMLIIYRVF